MNRLVSASLATEKLSPFHEQMLKDCQALIVQSSRAMSVNWEVWRHNDDVFRGKLTADKSDIAARERKEPGKIIAPLSYSQIMTFVAFCYALYTQKDRIFELSGFTNDDEPAAKVGEALLDYNLAYNKYPLTLVQFLLDIGRFGLGVKKISWETKKQMMRVRIPTAPLVYRGQTIGGGGSESVVKEVVEYQGNFITSVNPFHWLPDPNFPISRFQEGEFCGDESLISYTSLKQQEYEGSVVGVKFIKNRDRKFDEAHGWTTLDNSQSDGISEALSGDGQVKPPVVITEIQRWIIPAEYEVEGTPIGDEEYPVLYVIQIANGSRVIKCEPANYPHNQFTYVASQFIADSQSGLEPFALADVIDALQEVISWFINARITNVTKVIGDKLVVDESKFKMEDLENRRPIIRTKATSVGDISKYIMQLPLQDVTTNHIGDAKFLQELMQVVTGISDTILGVMQPGRKSATQVSKSTVAAATRLKMQADSIWCSGMDPMARQMLMNLRDGLEETQFVKLLGTDALEGMEFIPVNREQLLGRYDIVVYDGTQPSDRYFTAQALEELATVGLTNPIAATTLGLKVKELLLEAMRLRNIKNTKRFFLTPAEQQLALAQQMLINGPANPNTAVSPGGPTPGVENTPNESVLPGAGGPVI